LKVLELAVFHKRKLSRSIKTRMIGCFMGFRIVGLGIALERGRLVGRGTPITLLRVDDGEFRLFLFLENGATLHHSNWHSMMMMMMMMMSLMMSLR